MDGDCCVNQSETSKLLKAVREQRDHALSQIPETPPRRGRIADAWTKHYSLAMCARTPGHKQRIATKLLAAGIQPEFNAAGLLKVNSAADQRKKSKIVLGPRTVNYDSYY